MGSFWNEIAPQSISASGRHEDHEPLRKGERNDAGNHEMSLLDAVGELEKHAAFGDNLFSLLDSAHDLRVVALLQRRGSPAAARIFRADTST